MISDRKIANRLRRTLLPVVTVCADCGFAATTDGAAVAHFGSVEVALSEALAAHWVLSGHGPYAPQAGE